MTTIAYAPDVALRMARMTWHRHRWAVVGILALFGVATVALIAEGAAMRSWIDGHALARCAGGTPPPRCGAQAYSSGFFHAANTARLVFAVPGVAALFAGVPWLAREFETGSFRYTWVQGIKPVRWLLGVFGSLAGMAAAAALVCGAAFEWWYPVARWPVRFGDDNGWEWDAFGLSPIALVSWTIFAMALAMLTAAVIRRMVPAMATFAATYAGCVLLGERWLRPHLLAIAPVVTRATWSPIWRLPHWNDLQLHPFMTGPGGHVLTQAQEGAVFVAASRSSSTGQWFSAHHYEFWVVYQPHDRLVLFQLAFALILLTLSAWSVLTAVWLFRRRP